MKTNTVSSTPRSVGSSTCRKGNLLANILTCLAFIGALLGVAHTAKAQGPTSYTWNGSAEDLQWYTNTNWTPTGIPQSSSDTAIFNTSSGLILTGTTFSTISDLQFNTGAGGFVISTSATGGFGFNGGGITNNSGVLQFISLNAGALTFNNSSSAGAGTSGGVTIANSGGTVTFNDSSTAGNATISNSALGVTNFSGNVFSGAGSSHLSASGTNSAINFSSFATGGTSTITTSNGGKVVFGGSSSPLSADITANNGGSILFTGNSTGGIGSFTAASGGTFDISGHTGGLSVFSVEGSGTIALGANNLSVGGNNGSTGFQGVIQDAGASMGTGGSFTKTGTGTFTLSGANTYTGGTTISAGTLEIGGSAGAIVGNVANSGTLSFHRTGESDITYAGVVSGTGSVQQNGAGTLILTGENTYSGGTTINTGTLQIGDGTTIGSIVGDVTDNASLAFNHSDSVTYGGVISGTGNVKQNGVGTTILTGANTYTGGTTINTGTLQIGNGGSTGSIAGNVTNNATLAFNRTNSLIVAGKICGTGAVQQNGSGTTIFTGANTYSGGTAITAGALQIGNGGTIGSITGNVVNDAALIFNRCNTYTFAGIISGAGTVTQAGSGTTIFTGANTYSGGTTISGGTLQLGSGGTSGSITGDVTNNASLAFNHSDDVTFAGIISGSGNVKQTGSGKTIFTAANTYSGDTTISSGTLQIGADGMTGSIAGDVTNNSHLIFKRSDALAFAGVISGSGDVKQDGAGTTTLGGANTYTGGTHISAGALQIGNGGTTGSIVGDVVNDTSLIFNRSNASTYAGIITGAGAVTKLGAGTTTFTGDNLYTGGTTVSAGTLQLGNGGHTGTISGAVAVSAGATLAFNLDTVATYPSTSVISGMGSVEQKGTGTTIFKATNTYLGGTLISAGTLQIGDDGTEGSIVGNVIDNAALKFKHSDSVVFAGNISGTGTLEQAGSGALILTGDSTHTGGTTISAGSVVIGNNGTTGTLGGNIVDNGILVTNRSDALSVNGNISGTGSVQQNGAGATTLGGANTYTGGTTANAGTLKAGSTTAFGAATGALTASGTSTVDLNANNVTVGQLNGASGSTLTNEGGANATLTTSSNSTSVFAGLVKDGATNSTALAKSGTGALTLTHANTYTGGTTLNAGTLNLGNASAIGTGALTVAGTSMLDNTSGSALTLSTNNAVNLNADLTFTGTNSLDVGTGAWVLGGNRTLTVTNNSLTIGGDISGSGSRLTKSGAGDLYLTGANTYSGGTVISAGMLQVGNGGTTGSLVGNVTNNSVFAFNRTDASSFNGTIGGTGSVLQKGSGVLTIGGSNTYSGGTTIFDGTIKAGSGTALGTGNLDIANTGTFDLNGNNVSLGAISGASGTTITNNSGITNATLTTSSSSNTTFNGIIQDGMSNSTALAKSGTGALTLTHANTYSGGTTLNAGTLNLANASAIGTGALTVAGTSTIDNTIGTALTLSTNNALNLNADLTFTGTNDLNIGTGAVTLLGSRSLTVSANTLTVGGAVGGVGALTKAGAGTLILVNDNTYNGATTVSAGTLQLGAGGTTGAVTGNITDNAALIFDRSNTNTYNGVISGTGTVEKRSAGLLLLGGDNTYTGGTTITGGTVRVGNGATSGSIAGNVTNNAALAFNRSDSVTYAGVVSGSGTLEQMGPGTLILTGDHTYTGGTTVSSGTLQLGNGGTTGSVTGNITTEGILAINHSNAVTLAGVIDGTGSVQQNGTGATTLSGNNTFTNGVTVNAGTLNIGSATAIGTGTLNIAGVSTIDNSSGSALTLANNNVQTWGANFTFAGTNDLNLGTGAVTLTGNRTVTTTANNLTVGGVIDGAFSLTKAGAGTMTLANDNTYSGGTTISAGKLQIGNGGTTGSVLGDIADNGILSFNRSDALVHNGIISGTGSVQQDGSGSTTLNGANTYSGGTTVNAGTLLAGSSTALGAVTGNLAVNGTGTFDINGNNVTVGALNGASGATITNGDSVAATLTTSSSSNGTFAGTIQDGTHSTALAKSGTGALTLTHANTYTGGTTLNAGTLNFGSATAIGTGALNIAGASTIDNISGSGLTLTSNNPQTWGANFTFTGTNDLNLGTGAVTLTGNRTITASASNLTVGGIISGAFSLNKAGAGSVTLTGANTFSGGTTLTSGQLNVNSANALGTGALTIAGGVLDNTSGVPITLATNNALNLNSNLTFTGSDSLTFGTSAVSLGSATRTITVNGNPLILDGAVGGSTTKIGLTKAGTGTLVLNGANTYAGVTTISGGTLQLGNSTLQGSLATASKITDNATLAFELPNDSTFSNVISGTGAVVQNGENELTVSGANTYKGGTTVNNGTFVLGNAKALGATTGNLTVNSGTLDLNAKSVSVGTLSGSMGGAILNDGTKAATLTTTNASDTTFASAITDGVSAIAVTKKGAGALILTGTNTYSGKTTVSAGVLQFGNGGTTGSIASASLVNTGIVKVNRSNAFSYSGVISGKGSFQQNGSGTTTLTGTNTYTGGTVLNAGTLAVGNAKALGKGVVTLNDGTLATNGVQHEINVTGNLTWDSNAIIALTITEDSSSEFVNVVGQLKGLGSDPFTFDFTPVALTPGDHDFLVMSTTKGFGTLTADDFAFTSSDMGLTGTFSIVGKNLFFNDGYEPVSGGSGGMNSFADSGSVDGGLGGNISLNAGAVPEPSTWALLGLGAGFILFLRRRKMTGAAS